MRTGESGTEEADTDGRLRKEESGEADPQNGCRKAAE